MVMTPIRTSNPPSVNTLSYANPGDRVQADKGPVAPVVAILTRQLPLPQAQQLAGQTSLVRVLKSGPGDLTELDVNGQALSVKIPSGRTLTAGEWVTVSFALMDETGNLGVNSAQGKKTQDVRPGATPTSTLATSNTDEEADGQESGSLINRLSQGARLIGLVERLTQNQPTQVSTRVMLSLEQLSQNPALSTPGQSSAANTNPFAALTNNSPEKPAMAFPTLNRGSAASNGSTGAQQVSLNVNPAVTGALAAQVSSAVENSGLFYESHLQQWALGQRSQDKLALEPQSKFTQEQVIQEQGLNAAAVAQSGRMVNAQLAVLDQQRIELQLQGLLGRPVDIEIQPDDQGEQPSDVGEQEGNRPWVARLKLDMAHLGVLQVRIRMIGSNCDVQIASNAQGKQALDRHWRSFQDAMAGQGLRLSHGQVVVEDGNHG